MNKLKSKLAKLRDFIADCKIYSIRGYGWINSITALVSMSLLFEIKYNIKWYIVLVVGSAILLILGYLDILFGFLRAEQRRMNKNNPQLIEILNNIEKMKEK